MIICGIDYSISSPSLCVFKKDNDISKFENFHFFNLNSNEKEVEHLNLFKNISSSLHDKNYINNEDRFDIISNHFIKIIESFNTESIIGIEGYSFGSKNGMVFQIAENTSILKHKIFKSGKQFTIYSPSTVKKFFTGKGTANKIEMYDEFLKKYNVDFARSEAKRKISPYSDIIDSMAICLLTLHQLNEKI